VSCRRIFGELFGQYEEEGDREKGEQKQHAPYVPDPVVQFELWVFL
jgi:hypothetical protein